MRPLLAILAASALAGEAMGETVAYWRFEDNGDSLTNPSEFALELSPSVQFSDEVPAPFIVNDGERLTNSTSYRNGPSEEGTRLAASERLDEVIGLGSFTIEGFVRLADGAASAEHMRILGNLYYKGMPGGWSINVNAGKLTFGALQLLATDDTSAPGTLTASKAFTENTWHHFAVVGYRNPEALVVRLFIDGEEIEPEAPMNFYAKEKDGLAIRPNKDPILFSSKNVFKGDLDEIRISDAALDPSEFLSAGNP